MQINEKRTGYQLVQLCRLSQSQNEYIPANWEVKSVKDIAEVNPESIDVNYKEREILYIDIASIGNYRIQKYALFNLEKRPSRAQRIVRKNDIIVSTVRPYLKAFAKINDSKPNLICSTGFTVLRPKDSDNVDFIFNYVKSHHFEVNITRHMEGMAYPAITSGIVGDSLIIYPSNKNETIKIGSILSAVDKNIQKTEQVIEQTQKLKKGLLQKLLTQGIGHSKFKKVKSDFSSHEIPEHWELKKVGDLLREGIIVEIQDGNHGELHPKQKDFAESGIPFITANCIVNNEISLKHCQFLSADWLKKLRIGFAKENDVILSHKGTLGLSTLVPKGLNSVILSPQTTYYRTSDMLSPDFLFYVFQSRYFQKQLFQLGKQSTRDYIGIKSQRALVIPLVPPAEQEKITTVLTSVDRQIQLGINQNTIQKTLKKGLMQKLLTGMIRVKV